MRSDKFGYPRERFCFVKRHRKNIENEEQKYSAYNDIDDNLDEIPIYQKIDGYESEDDKTNDKITNEISEIIHNDLG